MNFSMTEEQAAMMETARAFAKKTVKPGVETYEKSGAPCPSEWIEKAGEMGLPLMIAPPELGGVGAGTLGAGIVLEELAAGCAGFATAVMGSMAAALAVQVTAPIDRARKLLAQDFEETGPAWRASLAGITDTSFEIGPNREVTGNAYGVIGAGHASWIAFPAKEGETVKLAFISGKSEGPAIENLSDPLGLRAAGLGKVTMDKVVLADDDIVENFDAEAVAALVTPLVGCVAVGCARAALDEAADYARERYQGGDRIIKHDTVAHLILNNRARINAARAGLWKAMAANDSKMDPETGALSGTPDVVESVLAKCFATDAAAQATVDAVQCFGGYGYMHDYPVNKRMRDARSLGLLFGTSPELMTYLKHHLEEG